MQTYDKINSWNENSEMLVYFLKVKQGYTIRQMKNRNWIWYYVPV
jgi:hypothetical protein